MELDRKKVSGTANTHSELWVLWQLYGQATGGETEAGQCQACGSAYAGGFAGVSASAPEATSNENVAL